MGTIVPFARAAAAHATMPGSDRASAMQDSGGSPDEARWAELMLRAQDGDRGAYHALLQAVTPYVRAIARRYLGRCEDAEDAVQDVLMIVHGIRHTFERGRPFKPWLGTIASRRCIDLLRRRAHRLRHEMEAGADTDDFPQTGHGPEETAAREYEAGYLHRAVAELPERQRQAIQLLRFKELSLDQAAAQSKQTVGSLKVACHRAIKSLQRALEKKDKPHD